MPGMIVTTSNRMERLIEELAALVRHPQPDPLTPETIVIQSRGMQRWISLELARLNGIAANCRFPFPKVFLEEVFAAYVPGLPEESDFDEDHLLFRILARLPRLAGRDPAFAPVRRYLTDDPAGRKAFQLAGRIARVFDQYLVFRPDLIRAWQAPDGPQFPADDWQARLWAELCADVPGLHTVALVARLEQLIRSHTPAARPLPPRVALFGISYLPPLHLHALDLLAGVIPVHLFLLNPCREFWGDIVSDREARRLRRTLAPGAQAHPRDDLHLERGHRLLASLGGVGRDFIGLISGFEGEIRERYEEPPAAHLLGRLQADILNLREPAPGATPTPNPGADGSIQVHACHSPLREVEVLHDLLLDLFQTAPEVEPRHVLVMTPDIEAYAPYIHAVFGAPGEERGRIPYSLADRRLPRESLLVEGFLSLLDVHRSRLESSRVMRLLDFPPLRKRFGLAEHDLETAGRWVRDGGIRWGLDARQRASQGLPAVEDHTWRAGMDRLLLGYLMAGDGERLYGAHLPHPPIEGDEARVLGRWLFFVEKLIEHYEELKIPKIPAEWNQYIQRMLDVFMASEDDTARERQFIATLGTRLETMARQAGFDAPLGVEVLEDFLAARLGRESLGGGFITGGVTFCALLPMRSIPLPVIALMGLNAEDFPRDDRPPGFDRMARQPRPGDRSRRADDKYLFLEALLAARRRLIVTYVGFDARDHVARPPAVPVCELLDVVGEDYGVSEERLVTRHRLQGFAPAYFDPSEQELFSYSATHLAAARSLEGARAEAGPPRVFCGRPLAAVEEAEKSVDLADLSGLLVHPARFFLEQRLGIHLHRQAVVETDREPFDLDPRARYRLGQSLVDKMLAGAGTEALLAVERAAGRLPAEPVGALRFREVAGDVQECLEAAAPQWPSAPRPPLEVDLVLENWRLVGRLDGLYADGQVLIRYATAKAQDLLGAWVRHLVLCATRPEGITLETRLINRNEVRRFDAVEPSAAILLRLLALYREGMQRPLPLFPLASLTYARKLQEGNQAPAAMVRARHDFAGSEFQRGDLADAYVALAWRGVPDPLGEEFEALAEEIYRELFAHSHVL
jgi:exodeoxyribonuclease V gamma subunit